MKSRTAYCLAIALGIGTGSAVGVAGIHGEVIKPGLTQGSVKVFYASEARVSFLSITLHSEYGASSDEKELSFWVPFYRVVFAIFGGLLGLIVWDVSQKHRRKNS